MRWLKRVGYRLSQVPGWVLYVSTGLFVIVIFFVWRATVFDDLLVRERAYVQSIQVLEQQKLLLPDMQYQVTSLKQKNDLLYNDLCSELHKFGVTDPYIQRERLLIDLDESGLSILSFSPAEGKKKALYEKNVLELKTVGTFKQICMFLRQLAESKMPMLFKKATIKKNDQLLSFDSTLAFYAFQREK